MIDVHGETPLMGKCVLERGSAGMEANKVMERETMLWR